MKNQLFKLMCAFKKGMRIIMDKSLQSSQNFLTGLSLVPIDTKKQEFAQIINIYEKAMYQTKSELENIQTALNKFYNYNVINNIDCRIKTPESIIKKMQRKNYDLNYKSLIANINDVAGIRIVCPFKSDIPKIRKIIENDSTIEVLEEKDYINAPKKSGYSGLHLIGQTPVEIGGHTANVKMEIQIRSMAMDFWSTTEHKIKYKAKSKLSTIDSKKMIMYAKMINKIDEKISKINNKYTKESN